MRLGVDTGAFSAALSRRRRVAFEQAEEKLSGDQIFLAAQTVVQLRYGAVGRRMG